ncbi:MAG: response regulator transcription factor [Planctomycetota bacterium]
MTTGAMEPLRRAESVHRTTRTGWLAGSFAGRTFHPSGQLDREGEDDMERTFESNGVAFEERKARKTTRVAVVAAIRLYREGIGSLLAAADALEVVGACGFSNAVVEVRDKVQPDVVLLGIGDPGWREALAALGPVRNRVPVVAFAVRETAEHIASCADEGIHSFVTAEASGQELIAAVMGAAAGKVVCSPGCAALIYAALASRRLDPGSSFPNAVLTQREREIFDLMRRGLSNKEIARQLAIQLATVKNHVHNMLGKLKVTSRTQISALSLMP